MVEMINSVMCISPQFKLILDMEKKPINILFSLYLKVREVHINNSHSRIIILKYLYIPS